MHLRIFAHHVQELCLGTGEFGLTPFEGLKINVKIEGNEVHFDGRYVGNRQGAVQEFTKRVAAMDPDIDFN